MENTKHSEARKKCNAEEKGERSLETHVQVDVVSSMPFARGTVKNWQRCKIAVINGHFQQDRSI